MRRKHQAFIDVLADEAQQHKSLCELNVIEQVVNVSQTTVVRDAWACGRSVGSAQVGYLWPAQRAVAGPRHVCHRRGGVVRQFRGGAQRSWPPNQAWRLKSPVVATSVAPAQTTEVTTTNFIASAEGARSRGSMTVEHTQRIDEQDHSCSWA